MIVHARIVAAVLRKDLLSLWPMVAVTATLLVLGVVFANFDLGNPAVAIYLDAACMVAGAFLAVALIQQDTAVSVTHDWLTRPIARADLVAAKGAFIALTLLGPVFATRVVVYLIDGYSIVEAVLAATNVSTYTLAFGLPVVIAAAVITPTLLQGAAVLIGGVFMMVFLLPTIAAQFVSSSNDDSISENVLYAGSDWIVLTTVGVGVALLTATVLWLEYGRRKTWLARTAFGVAMSVPLFGGAVVSLKDVIAVQQAVAPEPAPQDFAVELNGGCFLAESVHSSATAADGTDGSSPGSRFVGSSFWDRNVIERLGRGDIAFATGFSTDGLPKGWRLMIGRAAARYTDERGNVLERLQPARTSAADQGTLAGSVASTHYWLLRRAAAERLAQDPSTRITIDYSLSLLAPHAVELAVDGGWQSLPYVGYCSAERDATGATVTVRCVKRGAQPALISAKFAGALARAESLPPHYAPPWLPPLTGRRYEMTLRVPAGTDSAKLALTAYEPRAHFDRSVEAAGVLGGPVAACPLPPVERPDVTSEQSIWHDTSPHGITFVSVDEGVRLEVLDWGGSGRPLVLLAGLGDSAHVFDEMAPKLAQKYRVFGISRRGHGASTVAEAGYTLPRLTEDVVRVLDALKLESPVIAGSSIAGEELNVLAVKYSRRVAGLVYLDAVGDRTRENPPELRAASRLFPAPLPPAPRELESYAGLVEYLDRTDSARYPEGEILSIFQFGADGRIAGRRMDPRVPAAIADGVQAPDYAAFRVPALAISAMPRKDDVWRPWFDRSDAALARAVDTSYELQVALRQATERAFAQGVADSRVVELLGAQHHVWLSNEAEVMAELDAFIARLPGG